MTLEVKKKSANCSRAKSYVSNRVSFKRPVGLNCYASKRLYERYGVSTVRRNDETGNKRNMARTAFAFENEFTTTVVGDVVNVILLGFQKDWAKNEPEPNTVDGEFYLLG